MGADLYGWRVVGAVARAEQGVFGGMPDWLDWVVALHTGVDSKPERTQDYVGCSALPWTAKLFTVRAVIGMLIGKLPMHQDGLRCHNVFGSLVHPKLIAALHKNFSPAAGLHSTFLNAGKLCTTAIMRLTQATAEQMQ